MVESLTKTGAPTCWSTACCAMARNDIDSDVNVTDDEEGTVAATAAAAADAAAAAAAAVTAANAAAAAVAEETTPFEGPLTKDKVEAAELGGVGAEGSGDGAVLVIDEVTVLVESTETDVLSLGATTAATVGAECCTGP